MAACRLLMPVSWGCYHYAGNRGIRCSDENSGLLELVAIAQPMRGEELHVGESTAVFSSGAWINQQLPQDAHANMDGWVDPWRSRERESAQRDHPHTQPRRTARLVRLPPWDGDAGDARANGPWGMGSVG